MSSQPSPPLRLQKIEPWLVALATAIVLRLLLVRVDPRVVLPQWDEFIFLTNAKRLFLGLVPYRDYQWFVPPMGEAIYAAFFGLDGEASAALARSMAQVLATGTALFWYLSGRRLRLHPLLALLPGAAFVGLFFPVWSIPLHHWTAQWLASAAVYSALVAWTGSAGSWRRAWGAVAGALCVATGLTVQTQGVLLVGLLWGLWHLLGERDGKHGKVDKRGGLRGFVAGAVGLALIFVLWLVVTGTVGTFVEASVLYPFTRYHQAGGVNDVGWLADVPLRLGRLWGLPAPMALRLSLCAAEVALLVAGVATLCLALLSAAAVAHLRLRGRRVFVPWILLVPGCGLALWAVRPDVMHLAFYAPLMLAALWLHLSLAHEVDPRLPPITWALIGICAGLGSATHLLSPSLQGAPMPPLRARWTGPEPWLRGLPWVDAMMIAQDPGLQVLRKVALQHPSARMLALPEGALPYFLTLPPAVPDALLLPPQARYDGPRAYARTLKALQAQPPELLLLRPEREGLKFVHPPDWAGAESQALAAFLRQRFRPWMRVGASMIYLRADLPADFAQVAMPAFAP